MRIWVAVLACTVVLAEQATPALAATEVDVHGDIVTITVPIDCVGCRGRKAPGRKTDLAQYWKETVERIWNDAFRKWSYCGKYKLELDVEMKARADDFDSSPGRHRILVGAPGSGLEQTGWDGAVERTPEGDPGQRVPDGTRYFENDGDGAMPADVSPSVLAHEFGHVIGLGDDRDAEGNALPDRAAPGGTPTLMVGGAQLPDGPFVTPKTKLRIDKALVDRIGNQLVNVGKIKCGSRWTGTFEATATPTGTSAESGCQTATETGSVELTVHRRAVSGSITVSGSYTCSGITIPTSGTVRLEGTIDDDTIKFGVTTIEGLLLPAANCMVGQRLEIPLSKSAGDATFTSIAPSGDTYGCTIKIGRQAQAVA